MSNETQFIPVWRFSAQLHSRPGVPQIVEDAANGGLVLVATRLPDLDGSRRAVALLMDLNAFGFPNPGASATNAAPLVLARYADELAVLLDVFPQHIHWVEIDSERGFDMIHPCCLPVIAGRAPAIPEVEWTPLRFPPFEPRSRQAFFGAFGKKGKHLFNAAMIAAVGMPAVTA